MRPSAAVSVKVCVVIMLPVGWDAEICGAEGFEDLDLGVGSELGQGFVAAGKVVRE